MKKVIFIIALFCFTSLNAQDNKENTTLSEKVFGIISNGGSYFLNTQNGLVKIYKDEKDPYEEYYREIYNDTTIINPNTILKTEVYNSAIKYFNPAVDISEWADNYNTFGNNLYLYDFMTIDEFGNYVFKPGIIGLIRENIEEKK